MGMKKKLAKVGEVAARAKGGAKTAVVPVFRYLYQDTPKNLQYIAKRRALGERATAELGVQCWG